MEKIIHAVEFANPCENSVEKKLEVIETVESNYRIRHVHQYLHPDIPDIFFEFIHSSDPNEIQELNEDIKSNGWGVKNILEIENALDLLSVFQSFYHNTGHLPLTNGHLIVPDGDTLDGEEKINMKNLYEMFQHTKSHGLVSLPFLGALHMLFDGKEINQIKNALSELYKNLSYMTLSGAQTFDFDAISELISRISSLIKGCTLLNRDRRNGENAEKAEEIINKTSFDLKPNDPFQELVDNLYNNIGHRKTTHLYLEPQVLDPSTIETGHKR